MTHGVGRREFRAIITTRVLGVAFVLRIGWRAPSFMMEDTGTLYVDNRSAASTLHTECRYHWHSFIMKSMPRTCLLRAGCRLVDLLGQMEIDNSEALYIQMTPPIEVFER